MATRFLTSSSVILVGSHLSVSFLDISQKELITWDTCMAVMYEMTMLWSDAAKHLLRTQVLSSPLWWREIISFCSKFFRARKNAALSFSGVSVMGITFFKSSSVKASLPENHSYNFNDASNTVICLLLSIRVSFSKKKLLFPDSQLVS